MPHKWDCHLLLLLLPKYLASGHSWRSCLSWVIKRGKRVTRGTREVKAFGLGIFEIEYFRTFMGGSLSKIQAWSSGEHWRLTALSSVDRKCYDCKQASSGQTENTDRRQMQTKLWGFPRLRQGLAGKIMGIQGSSQQCLIWQCKVQRKNL